MAFDAKAATPDTSLPSGAFLIGADSQSAGDPSVYAVDTVVAPRIGTLIKNAPVVPPETTGTNMRMVAPYVTATTTTGTWAINRLNFVPVHFFRDRTMTEVGIHVSALAASGVARIGLYNDASGVPGTFVADFGEVSTASTGYKSITISQAVDSTKWYWFAVVFGTAAPGLVYGSTSVLFAGNNSTTTGLYGYMHHTYTYGTLPNTDRSGETFSRTSQPPIIYWT